MGLFNRFARAPEPDLMAQAVRNAYALGFDQGYKEGAAKAMELHADALDRALSISDYTPELTELLQTLSRHCKTVAAQQGVGQS